MRNTSGAETFTTLVARVFCVFGTPLTLVADNGTAFRNELAVKASQFFGYRHIPILPYNACANGTAESCVKRIKHLLDRHTIGYEGWTRQLPLAQYLLNTTIHSGHKCTPYYALFGREPYMLQHLENPSLLPEYGPSDDFISTLKPRLLHLHERLKSQSDVLKKAHAAELNAMRYSRSVDSRFTSVREGGHVWLLHPGAGTAGYIRQHGHGLPWKHLYKVKEKTRDGVRLEVPTDGSVPRVMEWQSIRRVVPAVPHPVWGLHTPPPDAPKVTESGLRVPTAEPSEPHQGAMGGLDLPEGEVYEIDKVDYAEKVGNRYKVYLRWKGYPEERSYRWRHELLKETSNPALIEEIESAVKEAQQRHATQHPGAGGEDGDAGEIPEGRALGEEEGDSEDARSKRRRDRAKRLESMLLVSPPDRLIDCSVSLDLRDYQAVKDSLLSLVSSYWFYRDRC